MFIYEVKRVPVEQCNKFVQAFNSNKVFVFRGVLWDKQSYNFIFAWPLCSDIDNIKLTIDILKHCLLV